MRNNNMVENNENTNIIEGGKKKFDKIVLFI